MVNSSEDRKAKIIRLVNLTDKAMEADFSIPGMQVASAWRCSTTEEKKDILKVQDNQVKVNLRPREVTSVRVE